MEFVIVKGNDFILKAAGEELTIGSNEAVLFPGDLFGLGDEKEAEFFPVVLKRSVENAIMFFYEIGLLFKFVCPVRTIFSPGSFHV